MSDETRRILELVAQGKITVAEAGELLKALNEARATEDPREPRSAESPRYLKISILKRRGDAFTMPGCCGSTHAGPREVNIKVPLSLVRSGMRLGAIIPGPANEALSQALHDRGFHVDLSKIRPEELDAILRELGDVTLDIDQGRAQVRISAE